jgi:hypothetical protein
VRPVVGTWSPICISALRVPFAEMGVLIVIRVLEAEAEQSNHQCRQRGAVGHVVHVRSGAAKITHSRDQNDKWTFTAHVVTDPPLRSMNKEGSL